MAIKIVCKKCGGTNVTKDATAVWSEHEQKWELEAVFDDPNWCEDCEGEASLEERLIPEVAP